MAEPIGRVALVTGANRGIGRAIALRLARNSDISKVAITYHSHSDEALEVVKEIAATTGIVQARSYQADFNDLDQVEALGANVLAEFGQVDVLVNNVGVPDDDLFVKFSVERYLTSYKRNVLSAEVLCHKILYARPKGMVRLGRGRIINISSISGLAGQEGQVNYSGDKAALIGLSKALAVELGGRGVTVNVIAPGYIKTAATEDVDPAILQAILDRQAIKRHGQPEEIAGIVAFLASDEAGFITRQVIQVDGGIA